MVDFGEANGKIRKAREELVNIQTLHSFGQENFTGENLPRSYSFDSLEAAKALLDRDEGTQPFVSGEMSAPQENLNELSMEELIYFLKIQTKAFLRKRLGMSLWDEDSPPDECEPFELGNLEKYAIKDRLLEIALKGDEDTDLLGAEIAKGSLPPGSLGEVWFNEAKRDVEEFIEMWKDELKGDRLRTIID